MGDVGQPTCLMHEEGGTSKALAGAVSTTTGGAKLSKGRGKVKYLSSDMPGMSSNHTF